MRDAIHPSRQLVRGGIKEQLARREKKENARESVFACNSAVIAYSLRLPKDSLDEIHTPTRRCNANSTIGFTQDLKPGFIQDSKLQAGGTAVRGCSGDMERMELH